MNWQKNDLIDILVKCLRKLHRDDSKLLSLKVGEDCLNHRLGLYLTKHFETGEVHVDLEYNRHLEEGKFYTDDKRAIVDIVIHQRDSDAFNICAIECKKKRTSVIDLQKIRSLISRRFYYQYGAIIIYNQKVLKLFWRERNRIKSEIIKY